MLNVYLLGHLCNYKRFHFRRAGWISTFPFAKCFQLWRYLPSWNAFESHMIKTSSWCCQTIDRHFAPNTRAKMLIIKLNLARGSISVANNKFQCLHMVQKIYNFILGFYEFQYMVYFWNDQSQESNFPQRDI